MLSDCIDEHFGSRPVIYKAGRYGVGPHTAAILEEQGYEVDMSLCPHMNYAAEEAPIFCTARSGPIGLVASERCWSCLSP